MSDMEVNDDQIESWREEQLQIASQVIIPELNEPSRIDVLDITSANSAAASHRYKNILLPSERIGLIGGVDVSFPEDESDESVAVYVILKYGGKDFESNNHPEVVYRAHAYFRLTVPYIPSYLAFREIEPLQQLIASQMESRPRLTPDLILVDGNGWLHERHAGIACFVGVRTALPTVGVGKTLYCMDGFTKEAVKRGVQRAVRDLYRLFFAEERPLWKRVGGRGEFDFSQTNSRGVILDTMPIAPQQAEMPVHDDNDGNISTKAPTEPTMEEMITALHPLTSGLAVPLRGLSGTVLACALVAHGGSIGSKHSPSHGTKNPIFISIGNKISLEEAVAICSRISMARVPEPVREADLYGRKLLRERQRENSSCGS